jgi:4-amino-4-deoxy-L-arabinose transferase-like glycosyltransferase
MPAHITLLVRRWPSLDRIHCGQFLQAASLQSSSSAIILMVLFGLAWIGHLSSVALTAPMDNIEQWVWSHSLQWGYHKHPPLPTWLLALPQLLTGSTALTSQILGALCTLASVMIFANLIRQIWGQQHAWIALLAGLCITFYNGRLNYYNHNVLLMLCVSMSAHCWWMILTTGRTRWWLGLGISAGLGMLSKYQYLLVLAPSTFMIWQLKPWRNKQQLRGLGLAILAATVLSLPHLWWLLQQDIANSPIRYALKTSRPDFLQTAIPITNRLHSGVWLMDLLFNRCLPAILILLIVKALCQPVTTDHKPNNSNAISGNHFLLIWGILPPLCITLLGLFLGMDLQMQWGTAFALWIIPPLMMLLKLHQRQVHQKHTWIVLSFFVLIQSLLMVHSYQTSAFGCCAQPASTRWRLFNSPVLAKELVDSASDSVGGHFKVIVGPATAAGAVAMAMEDHPKVLIDGNLKISPWIHHEELQEPGVIQLWAPNTGPATQTRLPSGWGWSPYLSLAQQPKADLPTRP